MNIIIIIKIFIILLATPKIERIQTKEIESNINNVNEIVKEEIVDTPVRRTRRSVKKSNDNEKVEIKHTPRRGRPRKNVNENKEVNTKENEVQEKERTTRRSKRDNNQIHNESVNENGDKDNHNNIKEEITTEESHKRKRVNVEEPVAKRTKRLLKNIKKEDNEVANKDDEVSKIDNTDDKQLDHDALGDENNKENILLHQKINEEPTEKTTPNTKRKRRSPNNKIEKKDDSQNNDNTTTPSTKNSRKKISDDKNDNESPDNESPDNESPDNESPDNESPDNNENRDSNPIEISSAVNGNPSVIQPLNETPERKRGLSNKLSLSFNKRIKKEPTENGNKGNKRSNIHSLSDIFKKDTIPTNDDIDKKLNFILSTLENSDLDKNLSSFTSDVASPPPHQILKSEKRKTKSQLNTISTTILNSSSDEDLRLVITPPPTTNVTFSRKGTPRTQRIKKEPLDHTHSNESKSNIHSIFNPQPTPVTSTLSNDRINNVHIKKENETLNTPSHQRTYNSAFSDIEIIENEKKLDSILSTLQNDNLLSLVSKKNESAKKQNFPSKTETPLKPVKKEIEPKGKITSLVDNPTPIYFSYLPQNNQDNDN